MKNGPVYKFTLYLLPSLLCLNLLLYFWFAGKTRETAAEEVVQKSYIISRLLSEFSARSLDRGELSGLKSIIEEVFKDRHIVSVTILDTKGGVIFQSAVPRTDHSLSTFETPVKLDGKSIAKLVTSFSLDESEEMIAGKLRRTAALQIVIFALVAALMAYLCRREKLFLQRPADVTYEDLIAVAEAEAAADPETSPERFDLAMKMELAGQTDQLCRASSSLEKAAGLLADQSGRQMESMGHVKECLALIDAWQRQALQDGGNAETLITSGRQIIEQVQIAVETDQGRGEAKTVDAGIVQLLQGIVSDIGVLVREGEKSGEINPLLSPDETLVVAAELVREGIATIRQQVFPSLAVAVGAGEDVVVRLDTLLERMDECGDRAGELSRRSSDLLELADGIRLLRRDLPFADSMDGNGEERLNLLAERLESIAAELKTETRELLGSANGATSSGRSIITAMEFSREKLLAAGSAVEDSSAASVMGGEYLKAFLRRARLGEPGEALAQPVSYDLIATLQSLSSRLENIIDAIARSGTAAEQAPEMSRAQSLDLAGENLMVAGRFLEEIVAAASELAKNQLGSAGLNDPAGTVANADAGQLIAAANKSLGELRLLELGEKGPGK